MAFALEQQFHDQRNHLVVVYDQVLAIPGLADSSIDPALALRVEINARTVMHVACGKAGFKISIARYGR
ncbi:MAG: hypothetical protein ABWY64_07995 [Tardiphaga sp.]